MIPDMKTNGFKGRTQFNQDADQNNRSDAKRDARVFGLSLKRQVSQPEMFQERRVDVAGLPTLMSTILRDQGEKFQAPAFDPVYDVTRCA